MKLTIALLINFIKTNIEPKKCETTYAKVECPITCFKGFDLPSHLNCQSGFKLCLDGTCKKKCSNEENKCKGYKIKDYRPFPNRYIFDVEKLDLENAIDYCIKDYKYLINEYKNTDHIIDLQSTLYYDINFLSPWFLSFYVFTAVQFLSLLSWFLLKYFLEKNIETKLAMTTSFEVFSSSFKEKRKTKQYELTVKGYNFSIIGMVNLIYLIIYSLYLISMLFMLSLDYNYDYYVFEEIAKGDDFNKIAIFFILWSFTFCWYLMIILFKNRWTNFYRLQSSPLSCQYIQVERELRQNYLNSNVYILKKLYLLKNAIIKILRLNIEAETCLLKKEKQVVFFHYRSCRYVYNSLIDTFTPFEFNLGIHLNDLYNQKTGLSYEEATRRIKLKGANQIYFKNKKFISFWTDELKQFFYIYRMMIAWLFIFYLYMEVGIAIIFFIIISSLTFTYLQYKIYLRVKTLCDQNETVQVLNEGEWNPISSLELVPGDVIKIASLRTVPADCVLLEGSVIVDESSLTGEPLPINKYPVKEEEVEYKPNLHHTLNTLFSGTRIIDCYHYKNEPVIALVHQTGEMTKKGKLIQDLLYSKGIDFIFDKELNIVYIILILFGITMGFYNMQLNGSELALWIDTLLAFSTLINPFLPIVFLLGIIITSFRLREFMSCLDLNKLLIAGKVKFFGFDKTGTLTKNGLEIVNFFEEKEKSFKELSTAFKIGISTCHSLVNLDHIQLGNMVDLEMIKISESEIIEGNKENYQIIKTKEENYYHIIKKYEFKHYKSYMSVIVFDPNTELYYLFIKGSFETIQPLCKPGSIDSSTCKKFEYLSTNGGYLICMGYKNLGKINPKGKEREELEAECDFLGLIHYQNNIKYDTANVIKEIKEGGIVPLMITGDNVFTAIHIAKLSNIIDDSKPVYLAKLKNEIILWENTDFKEQLNMEEISQNIEEIELAITSQEFYHLKENYPEVLKKVKIFSRMTPEDKVSCIEFFKLFGITGMCGDGSNDSGALKHAHFGIALSGSEASIVSSFTTTQSSLGCCSELIKHGRSNLVSSISNYKFLIGYGQIMAIIFLISCYFTTFIYYKWLFLLDSVVISLLSLGILLAKPASKLSKHRPSSKLLGWETLSSLLGQILVNLIFVISGVLLLFESEFYQCDPFSSEEFNVVQGQKEANYLSQTLAFILAFQVINSAVVYNFGGKFREPWIKNYFLVTFWMIFLSIVTMILFFPPNILGCYLYTNCGLIEKVGSISWTYKLPELYPLKQGHNIFPNGFKVLFFALMVFNGLANFWVERMMILGPVSKFLKMSRKSQDQD